MAKKKASAASKSIARNIEAAIGIRDGSEVYQFKISLDRAHLPIWRRIQTTDVALEDLHNQIQAAMGWEHAHLHGFEIDKVRYEPPSPSGDFDFGPALVDSRRVKLSSILTERRKGFKFKYEYDFGDGWIHTIAYEGRVPKDADASYPRCIEGENACPPEDCGGVWGYAAKMETGDLLDWVEDFDPHQFDVAEANSRMPRPRR